MGLAGRCLVGRARGLGRCARTDRAASRPGRSPAHHEAGVKGGPERSGVMLYGRFGAGQAGLGRWSTTLGPPVGVLREHRNGVVTLRDAGTGTHRGRRILEHGFLGNQSVPQHNSASVELTFLFRRCMLVAMTCPSRPLRPASQRALHGSPTPTPTV